MSLVMSEVSRVMCRTSAAGMVTDGGAGPGDKARAGTGHRNGHGGIGQRVDPRREMDAEPVGRTGRGGKGQVAGIIEGQGGVAEVARGGVGGGAETGNVFRHDLVSVGVAQGDTLVSVKVWVEGGASLVSGRSA